MDAKAYAAGEKAGREGKSAENNPHTTEGPSLISCLVLGPFAPLTGRDGDEGKASDWAEGHSAGSRNKK